jgi:site-specific DNA-methyltransferase (adenine-specific)
MSYELNRIYNEDCLIGMQRIEDNSIDCILSDPPYLYLKNQKFDRPFDESLFFSEAKRVLKKDGFIVLFGRGTSFYRWNTILSNMGFTFKEEIVWNKSYPSSPLMAITRIHETVSIHTSGSGVINKVKVPYLETKQDDIKSIITDIKRIKGVLKNTKSFDAVLNFLENNTTSYDGVHRPSTTVVGGTERINRCQSAVSAIKNGMNEKSIIKQAVNHYNTIHPTQKPVRLLERLMALVTKEGDIVLDPFSGSASVAITAYNTNRQFIAFEIDEKYYKAGNERLNSHINNNRNLFTYETDIKTNS